MTEDDYSALKKEFFITTIVAAVFFYTFVILAFIFDIH